MWAHASFSSSVVFSPAGHKKFRERSTALCTHEPDICIVMNEFEIETVNPYFRNRRLPVALLHFTAGFLLLNAFLEGLSLHPSSWLNYFFLLLGAFELVYSFFAVRMLRKKPMLNALIRVLAAIGFFINACILVASNQQIMGIFIFLIAFTFLFIAFIEKKWGQPFIIRFTGNGVDFPALLKTRHIAWERLNGVILRNDVLTLDFKSNRVLQLMEKSAYSEEQRHAFNTFAAEHCKK